MALVLKVKYDCWVKIGDARILISKFQGSQFRLIIDAPRTTTIERFDHEGNLLVKKNSMACAVEEETPQ